METPLIGKNGQIEKIKELIEHVADTGLNVVITGESGVGKEVVAQNLYYSSKRNKRPFVKINCAALPEGLLESELFGFEQGAFTGAQRKKRGKFEIASDGVLFLDEICDMSLPLQSKLLHVLQSGEFSRLGSEKEVKTNAWVIAATNQELEKSVSQGTFREDLYYRLNIIRITIPPLRERSEDIPLLTDYFLEKYASQFNNKQFTKPGPQIIKKMLAYHWPGNVRELQNFLKRGMVVGRWEESVNELGGCERPHTSEAQNSGPQRWQGSSIIDDLISFEEQNGSDLNSFSLKEVKKKALEKIEREAISYVLEKTGWNRSKATKILKISYKTLLYKISDLNIKPENNHGE